MSERAPLSRKDLGLLGAMARHRPYFGLETRRNLIAQSRAYLDLVDRLEALSERWEGCAQVAAPNYTADALYRCALDVRGLLRKPLEPEPRDNKEDDDV